MRGCVAKSWSCRSCCRCSSVTSRKEILDFMDPAGELNIGDVSSRDVPGRRTSVLDGTNSLHVNTAGANCWLHVHVLSVNSDGECDGCR